VLLAHQQNIVVRLDDGWPVGMYYRDCQGSGVTERFRYCHPEAGDPPDEILAPATVRRYFLYYVILNATMAVTAALDADGLADEDALCEQLREHLAGLRQRLDGDTDCLAAALNEPTIQAKRNFHCAVTELNEATLADPTPIYTTLSNPLAPSGGPQHTEGPMATATPAANEQDHTNLIRLDDAAARLLRPRSAEQATLAEQVDQAFAHHHDLDLVILDTDQWQRHPEWQAIVETFGGPRVLRDHFYEQPWPWLGHEPITPRETPFDARLGHPRRPAQPGGEVYRRRDPRIDRVFRLRVADASKDLERFIEWMHRPRVAEFWEKAWSREALSEVLAQRLAEPQSLPLIGEFDGEPFGYFECYWAAEDRLAPYYAWAPFDRGLHLAVGEERWRGPEFVAAWLTGLQHYCYLAEPRTQRIVLEPRHDNERLFRHLPRVGLNHQREFDFPHKRAALFMGHRRTFVREVL